jgi:hypothetical protein
LFEAPTPVGPKQLEELYLESTFEPE